MGESLTNYKQEQQVQPDPISVKEQKTYEKKLKQYEKEKEKYDYLFKNQERIIANKKAIENHNTTNTKLYNSFKKWVILPNKPTRKVRDMFWYNDLEGLARNSAHSSPNRYELELNPIGRGDIKAITKEIKWLKLTAWDKKYWLVPKHKWSYLFTTTDDSRTIGEDLTIFESFTFILPTKPTPPEKPLVKEAKQELSELKKEVLTSKEMNVSRKTHGDTVPTKLEVISEWNTITLDKETFNLYIQYKATRNERPHDLDLSFEHFQKVYLDKVPGFMRKRQ